MRTGILITARMGSRRLKKKHFTEVNGKPIFTILLNRIATAFEKKFPIIVATSEETENHAFEVFKEIGAKVCYGAINNIPLRHLQIAETSKLDAIVAVDGDDILCSTNGMKFVRAALESGNHYVKTSGLPFGMNCVGYSVDFLRSSLEGFENKVLETGWGRIFSEDKVKEIKFPKILSDDKPTQRYTLDYEEDYVFFKAVIEGMKDTITSATDHDIVEFVSQYGLHKLNSNVDAKYWENFNKQKENEKKVYG